jgi:hypothetical protein
MTVIFSLDLDSKRYLKHMSISDERFGRVSFEGNLGSLKEVSLIDDNALEINGRFGTLIVEITREVLQNAINISTNKKS